MRQAAHEGSCATSYDWVEYFYGNAPDPVLPWDDNWRVLILRLLPFQLLFVLVVLVLALALLAECVFRLFALALRGPRLLLPFGPARLDFGLQALPFALVILDQLIDGGGGNVDLMQPLKLLAL